MREKRDTVLSESHVVWLMKSTQTYSQYLIILIGHQGGAYRRFLCIQTLTSYALTNNIYVELQAVSPCLLSHWVNYWHLFFIHHPIRLCLFILYKLGDQMKNKSGPKCRTLFWRWPLQTSPSHENLPLTQLKLHFFISLVDSLMDFLCGEKEWGLEGSGGGTYTSQSVSSAKLEERRKAFIFRMTLRPP